MAEKINKNHLGLTLGLFAALCHLVWAALVGIGIAKSLIDWVLPLHFLSITYSVSEFSIVNAVLLVVLGFIVGYITGWVFAWLWNWLGKKVK